MQSPTTRRRVATATPAATVAVPTMPVLPDLEFHMPNGLLVIKRAPEALRLLEHHQAAKLAAEAEQAALSVCYRLSGDPDTSLPHGGLLTRRLGISESTARALITDGRLKYTCLGRKAYRISELAVRQFLGDAPA